MQVEDWGEMEIRLYSMFLFAFEVNTIYTLMRTAVQRSQAYQAISETKNLLYTLLINSFSVFLKEDKWAYAKEVLEMFDEEYAEKTDKIDIHAQFHFNHGLLAFRENRIEEAKKYCEEAIQMCERTKQFEMVNILKRRYKQWLKNPQLKEVFIQVGWPENRI
jgi:Rgg/GadR/MutR family transcriptional activator